MTNRAELNRAERTELNRPEPRVTEVNRAEQKRREPNWDEKKRTVPNCEAHRYAELQMEKGSAVFVMHLCAYMQLLCFI